MTKVKYTLQKGETLAGIALANNMDPKLVMDDPDNAQLKQKRSNLNILMEGDVITIPEKQQKTGNISVGSKASVNLNSKKQVLCFQLIEEGKPAGDCPYSLLLIDPAGRELHIDGKKTGKDGLVKEEIPDSYVNRHGSTIAHLIIYGIHYEVTIGGLNPISRISGVQQRLRNLGFRLDVTGVIDVATFYAVKGFQALRGLDENGKIDDKFRQELVHYHDNDQYSLPAEDNFSTPDSVLQAVKNDK